MQYVPFGKHGFDVSRLGFGCMRLPTKQEGEQRVIDREAAIPLIRRGIDGGVTYVDTAYPYHNGESEIVVGLALKDGYRERVKLTTKLPIWAVNEEKDMNRLLDEQLKKLDVPYVDFYLLHAMGNDRLDQRDERKGRYRAMKKISALLLAILLVLGTLPGMADSSLTVGNPTPMRGEFFTELWGNATSDNDVRDLLHGYNLTYWDGYQRNFATDPSVVKSLEVSDDPATGDRSYVFTLMDDLLYSDGSRITAWDYAFSLLLQMSYEVSQIGGTPLHRDYIAGAEAYRADAEAYWTAVEADPEKAQQIEGGVITRLAGVRVLADDMLQITVVHNYLPFYYELGLMRLNPYPIGVIAPGVVVKDDGSGVYLANEDDTVREPAFNAELLNKTILDPETGYLSYPSVVSGPYCLTDWDGVTAKLAINSYYKGNASGVKPTIQQLIFTVADNDTMMDQLKNGEFGLLNKVLRVDSVLAGEELVKEGSFRSSAYPRTGLSFISFCCERPAMASQAVRQAIAWCIDRDALIEDYTGKFGQRVDGYYGVGQWMYGIIAGTVLPPVEPPKDKTDDAAVQAYLDAIAPYKKLSLKDLTAYTADTDQAAALLDADGWTLNEQGIREKEIDGEKVTLELTLIYPEGNDIYLSFEKNAVPYLKEAGIELTMKALPMGQLLSQYYKQDDREADMYYLASNFELLFDPSEHFQTADDGSHNWSYTNCADQQLYDLALAMRTTEPDDPLTYCQKWIAFQKEFNMQLPMLPIYSNTYFDFYFQDLQEYWITNETSWGIAIVGSYIEAPPETIAEEN